VTVLGCSGHQDIPPAADDFVAQGVRAEIARHGPTGLIGISSLAIGADQLFAESILQANGHLHVVVPCAGYGQTFAAHDRARYESLLSAAATIERLAYPRPSDDAYLAAGQRVADRADLLLAVWDGRPAGGRGGTADIVTYARRTGTPVVVIWPDGVRRAT
jgi:hypothetical protein